MLSQILKHSFVSKSFLEWVSLKKIFKIPYSKKNFNVLNFHEFSQISFSQINSQLEVCTVCIYVGVLMSNMIKKNLFFQGYNFINKI